MPNRLASAEQLRQDGGLRVEKWLAARWPVVGVPLKQPQPPKRAGPLKNTGSYTQGSSTPGLFEMEGCLIPTKLLSFQDHANVLYLGCV